jgi:nicotinamide mononucleotide transporter
MTYIKSSRSLKNFPENSNLESLYGIIVAYCTLGTSMVFDIIGAFVSLLSTYFFIQLNNKAWPVGILATALNGWLYWHKGIYADMILEFCYFLSLCYGWYLWRKKDINNTLGIEQATLNTLTLRQWMALGTSLCLMYILIHYFLQSFTNSNIAFMDAASTSLSLVAQWLMCHKIIATWLLWFITDALYAFMYYAKDLPFHTILMLVYTGMAVTGYWVWVGRNRAAARIPRLS